ncbi:MAG: ATP-binding cassette domain-containing protein [Miltoncostaeaceae bacterium]
MSEEPPVLRVTELEVRYYGGPEPAVSDVSLTLAEGEALCIAGGAGAGKSTILRAILGLTPFTGDIELFGRPPGAAERRRVGYGPQAFDFAAGMSSREVMAMVARLRGVDRDAIPESLRRAALPEDRWDIRVGSDSATSRRLALALAGLGDPALVIVDDPPNDPASDALVRRARERGAAVLVAVTDPWPDLLTALDGPTITLTDGLPE